MAGRGEASVGNLTAGEGSEREARREAGTKRTVLGLSETSVCIPASLHLDTDDRCRNNYKYMYIYLCVSAWLCANTQVRMCVKISSVCSQGLEAATAQSSELGLYYMFPMKGIGAP